MQFLQNALLIVASISSLGITTAILKVFFRPSFCMFMRTRLEKREWIDRDDEYGLAKCRRFYDSHGWIWLSWGGRQSRCERALSWFNLNKTENWEPLFWKIARKWPQKSFPSLFFSSIFDEFSVIFSSFTQFLTNYPILINLFWKCFIFLPVLAHFLLIFCNIPAIFCTLLAHFLF